MRRDLRELADAGKCRRVYGGALPLADASPFAARILRDTPAKRALARAALSLIAPGQTLYLDAGTTNLALARALPDDAALTVVTNSVSIAAELSGREGLDLFVIGGHFDPLVDGALGAAAIAQIGNFRPDLCFVGPCALQADIGVMSLSAEDADCKRAAVRASSAVATLATLDKLAASSAHLVVPISELDALVIEAGSSPADREAFARSGVNIIEAEAADLETVKERA